MIRRLKVGIEKEIITPTSKDRGGLRLFYISTYSDAGGILKLISFIYNYITHYVVIYRVGTDTLDDATLSAAGIPLDSLVIPVAATQVSGSWVLDDIGLTISEYMGFEYDYYAPDVSGTRIDLRTTIYGTRYKITSLNAYDLVYIYLATVINDTFSVDVVSYEAENKIELDIDEQTTLGFTNSSFDFKNPATLPLKHSNAFTLPNTSKNSFISGHMGQSLSSYKRMLADYTLDNELLISNGHLFLDKVSDRLHVILTEKNSVFEKLGNQDFNEFIQEYYEWLTTQETIQYTSYSDYIAWLDTSNHLQIPYFYGDLSADSELSIDPSYKSTRDEIKLIHNTINGAQICIKVTSILDFINYKYGVDFTGGSGNIFSYIDPLFQCRILSCFYLSTGIGYFSIYPILNQDGKKLYEGKTVLDWFKTFLVHSNCVIDFVEPNIYGIYPLDALDSAPLYNLSGRIEKDIEVSYKLDGLAQNNTIDFTNYSDDIVEGILSKTIVCKNRNLDSSKEYIKINEFIPKAIGYESMSVLCLWDENTRKDFTFLTQSTTEKIASITFKSGSLDYSGNRRVNLAEIMPLGYTKLAEMIEYPVIYKIRKWLTKQDMLNLKKFQRYQVDELNGIYMITDISGFNPEGMKQAVDIELLLITRIK